MSTIKACLTIDLEGTLSHETKSVVIPWKKSTEDDPYKIIETGTCIHKERLVRTVKKRLNISEDSYNYMTSDESAPASYNHHRYQGKPWRALSAKDKLKYHCSLIADGRNFTVEVLD